MFGVLLKMEGLEKYTRENRMLKTFHLSTGYTIKLADICAISDVKQKESGFSFHVHVLSELHFEIYNKNKSVVEKEYARLLDDWHNR